MIDKDEERLQEETLCEYWYVDDKPGEALDTKKVEEATKQEMDDFRNMNVYEFCKGRT